MVWCDGLPPTEYSGYEISLFAKVREGPQPPRDSRLHVQAAPAAAAACSSCKPWCLILQVRARLDWSDQMLNWSCLGAQLLTACRGGLYQTTARGGHAVLSCQFLFSNFHLAPADWDAMIDHLEAADGVCDIAVAGVNVSPHSGMPCSRVCGRQALSRMRMDTAALQETTVSVSSAAAQVMSPYLDRGIIFSWPTFRCGHAMELLCSLVQNARHQWAVLATNGQWSAALGYHAHPAALALPSGALFIVHAALSCANRWTRPAVQEWPQHPDRPHQHISRLLGACASSFH